MREIEIADGLRLRFKGRGAEFDEGVEIGVLAALMSTGSRSLRQWISRETLPQARTLAQGLGYRLVVSGETEGAVEVVMETGRARPALRLVSGGEG